jgi:hypothetical protein
LVGNHVGLLSESVKHLNCANQVTSSLSSKNRKEISSIIWGSAMYKALRNTRAVNILQDCDVIELQSAFLSSVEGNFDSQTQESNLSSFVKRGILVEVDYGHLWSSKIMYRYFIENLQGDKATRSSICPSSLRDMVTKTLKQIDYHSLIGSLGNFFISSLSCCDKSC